MIQEEQDVDALGRIVTVRRFDGQRPVTGSYEYDPQGHVTKVVDPDGTATVMTYDLAGRLLSHARPDTGTTLFVYDAAGNQVQGATRPVRRSRRRSTRSAACSRSAIPGPPHPKSPTSTSTLAPPFRRTARATGSAASIASPTGSARSPSPTTSQARVIASDRVVIELPGQHFATSQAFDKLGRVSALTLPATTACARGRYSITPTTPAGSSARSPPWSTRCSAMPPAA